jgi:hypothetical protein
MRGDDNRVVEKEIPPSVEVIKQGIRVEVESIIDFCTKAESSTFFGIEKQLHVMISALACMFFQLFLMSFQERIDYSRWMNTGLYYIGDLVGRRIKTIYGEVFYWRTYLIRKGNKCGGIYPLDIEIGITRDGFSPRVMSLATKLATRVSFGVSVILFKCFYGWSPSSEAIESLVLGMGRDASAYMEQIEGWPGDGEILVIEVDGKATPTAREKELEKRRGKRKKQKSCCQRHRTKKKRQNRCKSKRRKKGDKSKNGRSITLVVMYTLKIGDDGKLHGPINKKVWGSYAQRKVMLDWAKQQATKRGFPPDTDKRVHIVIDGEKCLYDGLSKLFPNASFALDIRHLEEKIWKLGGQFHKEGSEELEQWVEAKIELLYTGRVAELLSELKKLKISLSARAKRDQSKREAVSNLIGYMEPRLNMMNYQELIEQDLVIASGVVEGAARYVVAERMDCGGMRWIPERAESLLRLRCIELNGDWDDFFQWGYENWMERMKQGEKVIIRQVKPDELPKIDTLGTNGQIQDELEQYGDVANF